MESYHKIVDELERKETMYRKKMEQLEKIYRAAESGEYGGTPLTPEMEKSLYNMAKIGKKQVGSLEKEIKGLKKMEAEQRGEFSKKPIEAVTTGKSGSVDSAVFDVIQESDRFKEMKKALDKKRASESS